jgi:outer membrane protein
MRARRSKRAFALRHALPAVALLVLLQAEARAEDTQAAAASTLELGVGVAALRFPDYPGSERSRELVLPFPYIVYRSPHLDVSNRRVRGIVIAGSRFSLDVDFAGSVAVDSSRNPERRGMPNLDWIGEAGPALRYNAWNDTRKTTAVDLVLPARAAVSTRGLQLHQRGWVWAPRVEWRRRTGGATYSDEFDASLGASWTGSALNDYVYGVAPQYATPQRPAFEPGGGYSGYSASFGMSLRRGSVVYGWFVRYTDLSGSVVDGSPLVSRPHSTSVGVAVAWILSSRR